MTTVTRSCLIAAICACAIVSYVNSHTYHLGDCPSVEPMSGFEMSKFLGIWHVIQKTSTGSKCLYYNYTEGHEPGEYLIEQVSEHPVLGIASVDNKYHYTGTLKQISRDTPAKMSVSFPLNPAGKASYTVFMTDYDNYAAIFSCQKLPASNRRSASILSRKQTLEKQYVDKIRNRLSAYGVSPFDLSVINHQGCPADPKLSFSINPDTFSAHNIADAVRKTGEVIGDGVETGINYAKKAYDSVKSKDEIEELSKK